MDINVGTIIFDGSDFRPAYNEVVVSSEDFCACGSTKFIDFEKAQYASGITANRTCLECGLVYSRIGVLAEHGGTEESIYHARWFIRGIHSDELIASYSRARLS